MSEKRWKADVRKRRGDYCCARKHAPGCSLSGVHIHHIVFKSSCPAFTHYAVIENGIPLSLECHALAHGSPKNGNLYPADIALAEQYIISAIARSPKPFLRIKRHEYTT